ncbi:hypothetical protein BDZ45DRAFT_678099, partial [Acephala macrosclerotiorum]
MIQSSKAPSRLEHLAIESRVDDYLTSTSFSTRKPLFDLDKPKKLCVSSPRVIRSENPAHKLETFSHQMYFISTDLLAEPGKRRCTENEDGSLDPLVVKDPGSQGRKMRLLINDILSWTLCAMLRDEVEISFVPPVDLTRYLLPSWKLRVECVGLATADFHTTTIRNSRQSRFLRHYSMSIFEL